MAVYYVDAKSGNNSNNGLSENSAWSSIDGVNSHSFKPGDTILFHSDQVFYGTLAPHNSGTASAPISFGKYGDGAAPILTGGVDVTHHSWADNGGHVWSTTVPNEGRWGTENVWFNGKGGNIESSSPSAMHASGDWYYDTGAQKLYVYSASNPSSAGTRVEANVQDYGVLINGQNNIHLVDLQIQQSRYDVMISHSSGSMVLDSNVHQSVRDGIVLSDASYSVLQGGQSHDNGVNGSLKNMTHLGHGVLLADGANHNTVSGMQLYNNAEDGVQFGPTSGSNNHIAHNDIHGQGEDGIDDKGGAQFIEGNSIHDNTVNGILIHDYATTTTITDNHIETVTRANALFGNAGHVVSNGNWYEGQWSHAVRLSNGEADGSSFTNDTFVDGGSHGKMSVLVESSHNVNFNHDTFVMGNDGYALTVSGAADHVSVSNSVLYGESGGDLINVDPGKTVSLSHNNYWDASGDGSWFKAGGADQGANWASSADHKAVVADPKFNDSANHDFSFKAGSPATGQGSQGSNSAATHYLTGTGDADHVFGLSGNNVINGGDGNDKLIGLDGADQLHGGNGSDILDGGKGNDILAGGPGNDFLFGNQGADTFVFGKNDGYDVVKDFQHGVDTIDLHALGLTATPAQVLAGGHDNPHGSATFDFADTHVELAHVSVHDLSPNDFHV